jgi:hypothetical protein
VDVRIETLAQERRQFLTLFRGEPHGVSWRARDNSIAAVGHVLTSRIDRCRAHRETRPG